jgi:uncharacterized protein YjgD (DUF1641 family)
MKLTDALADYVAVMPNGSLDNIKYCISITPKKEIISIIHEFTYNEYIIKMSKNSSILLELLTCFAQIFINKN